ncbi:Uma2 family endonuclease [Flavisolibacter ginsenosidimutans]|uniref:Uma2 family endonuclease n=1 Tax=Flavisolibacter ginsenosidimutans TaxID=661481 RepID=A0A5B8ULW2_9BACT|nr:Uma2 family endonuclease [Flavisolibacter ginsenosidimutans]QEC57661.1 Uma2 family endonuclease [Flavisolibacter ginsenosidimutans]
MSSAVKILPYYTYEDYVQWEGRWELIDGIPYAMSPAPTPKHQMIANTLGALFYLALKNCKHCKAYQFVDFKIAEHTIVQPDISILCRPTTKKFVDFPPSLVVEILSTSTALKDRHAKSTLYRQQDIPFYLIVSTDTEETEVYVLENGEYVLKQKGKEFQYSFQFEEGCEATIDFAEIWK